MNKRNFILHLFLYSVITLLVTFNTTAALPSYYFRSLSTNEGLSQNTVNVILQDKQGFMWFGTKDGLNRYDGQKFRLFQKENSSLGNNFITALYEDPNGSIWVGTDTGMYIYNPHQECFSAFTIPIEKSSSSITRSVTCIQHDGKGNIWIAADYQGLLCYNTQTGKLQNISDRIGHTKANITHFWFEQNMIWVGRYEDNLYYSQDNGKTFQIFKDINGKEPFKGSVIETITKGLHNCLYIGSSKGLTEINLSTSTCRTLLNDYVRDISFHSDKELWAGTEHGLYIIDLSTQKQIHLQTTDESDKYALSDNAIYTVYQDRDEGMWIGSYFGGVNYYPYQYTYFEKYYPHNHLFDMGRRVREFCRESDTTVWIGTEDKGVFHFNQNSGQLTALPYTLCSSNIHGLCMDNEWLWIGTFNGGLYKINIRTHSIKHYTKGNTSNTLNADNIFTICKTSTNDIWIGTTSGLLHYNRATDDFQRISKLDNVFAYYLLEDSYGNIWVATYVEGVFCYDVHRKKWKHYTWDQTNPHSLPYNKVVSIYEDSQKRLWFATEGGGICRFIPETNTFIRYGMEKGFPSNTTYKIQEDKKGILWITTDRGLVSFDPEKEITHIYTTSNGLLSNQFNYQSGFRDPDGNLYFGSINGFIRFNPSSFKENTQVSPIALSDFLLFNKRLKIGNQGSPLKQSITFTDTLQLKAYQNSFSLRAFVLSYQAPQSNTVLCKMEGFDKDWYTVSANDARITYSNLPYGTYTLRIKGANSDGIWNPKERQLHIQVLPPFYLSWTAYILYFVLFIGGAYSAAMYIRQRNQRRHQHAIEKLQYEKERELYTAKIDFFTNVAHEIRTPLTLIKSPLENVLSTCNLDDNTREDLNIMDLNTNRLLDLVNQLLDFRKTETKGFKLNFSNYNLSELVHKTCIRFTTLARERRINLSEEIIDGIHAAIDKEGFTKIISNLLTNAVKYAKTYIHLKLKTSNDNLILTITNDGEIIPLEMREEIFKPFIQYHTENTPTSSGTGIGLALARSLAELHGGNLVMSDSESSNCFVLSLPLRQLHIIELPSEDQTSLESVSEEESSKQKQTIESAIYTLMLVEDNHTMRKFLSRQLSPSYRIFEATNGKEALGILKSEIINLIISDIIMPEMDGIELCYTVKNEIDFSHIPVILLTAKTTLQSKIEGMETGADAYIEKPFSLDYLKACIANLLKSRERLQTSFAHTPFIPTNSMAISKADEDFLKKLNELVQDNIQNPDFNLDEMSDELCMSRSSLYRKIKGILNITPYEYVRLERLKKAAQLLKDGSCKINEVSYLVGFNTPSYFTKCFQKQFGMLPKDFVGH